MTYSTYSLVPLGAANFVGSNADPIKQYGQRASEYILRRLSYVPTENRQVALEAVLESVDPNLPGRVASKRRAFQSAGVPPDVAERSAIAAAMSEGILHEMIDLGRKRAPKARSLVGVGSWNAHEALGLVMMTATKLATKTPQNKYGSGTDADPWRFPESMLKGTVRDHRIMNLAPFKKAYADAITRYGKIGTLGIGRMLQGLLREGKVPFTRFTVAESKRLPWGQTVTAGQKYGIYWNEKYGTMAIKKIPRRKRGALERIGNALKSIGKGIIAAPRAIVEAGVKGAQKIAEAGKDIVGKLGDLACGIVNHPAGAAAAAGAAASYGAPPEAGAIGVNVAKDFCNGDEAGVPPDVLAPPPSYPKWLLPAAIGGGALILVLALR